MPAKVLSPREAWSDKEDYDATRIKLAGMFKDNFTKFVKVRARTNPASLTLCHNNCFTACLFLTLVHKTTFPRSARCAFRRSTPVKPLAQRPVLLPSSTHNPSSCTTVQAGFQRRRDANTHIHITKLTQQFDFSPQELRREARNVMCAYVLQVNGCSGWCVCVNACRTQLVVCEPPLFPPLPPPPLCFGFPHAALSCAAPPLPLFCIPHAVLGSASTCYICTDCGTTAGCD